MKAVILAAGRGTRLSPITDKVPKPLVPINGMPLISHVLSTMRDAGLSDFIVVTGYRGDAISERLNSGPMGGAGIRFVHNPFYRTGNASSLLSAEGALRGEESFLLAMSDHIFERKIVESAIDRYTGEPLLCVDEKPTYAVDIDDATKVLVNEDGYIEDIGKAIPVWTAIDTGVFHLNTDLFRIVRGGAPAVVSDCIKILAERSRLMACDVSGSMWFDVDTMEDLELAERVMDEWG